ncbi:MAG: nucleotide exchange factor GrpE [Magnetococcales bacterium]|nr:nucleotide exchange factor GrpE [Magnetococcales bacterium]
MIDKPQADNIENLADKMDDSQFEAPQGDNTGPTGTGATDATPKDALDAATVEPKKDEIDFKDKYIRLMADMDNLRKRTARDVEDARRYAVSAFARDMLDIADNLDRALAVVEKDKVENEQVKSMLAGVEMVNEQMSRVFKQFKVEKTMPELGEKLNPELHQAMFEVESTEYQPGHIAQVMQPGYTIAGRLLRPAMVGTAKKVANTDTQGGDDAASDKQKQA